MNQMAGKLKPPFRYCLCFEDGPCYPGGGAFGSFNTVRNPKEELPPQLADAHDFDEDDIKKMDRVIKKSLSGILADPCAGNSTALFGDSIRRPGFRDPRKIRQPVLSILSPEYSGRNINYAQYMQDLYDTFMRRFARTSEVNYRVNELSHGTKTREQLRQFFIQSPEFQRMGLNHDQRGML
jgi:hypothetical protein